MYIRPWPSPPTVTTPPSSAGNTLRNRLGCGGGGGCFHTYLILYSKNVSGVWLDIVLFMLMITAVHCHVAQFTSNYNSDIICLRYAFVVVWLFCFFNHSQGYAFFWIDIRASWSQRVSVPLYLINKYKAIDLTKYVNEAWARTQCRGRAGRLGPVRIAQHYTTQYFKIKWI